MEAIRGSQAQASYYNHRFTGQSLGAEYSFADHPAGKSYDSFWNLVGFVGFVSPWGRPTLRVLLQSVGTGLWSALALWQRTSRGNNQLTALQPIQVYTSIVHRPHVQYSSTSTPRTPAPMLPPSPKNTLNARIVQLGTSSIIQSRHI
jgi:hypothetical protein